MQRNTDLNEENVFSGRIVFQQARRAHRERESEHRAADGTVAENDDDMKR